MTAIARFAFAAAILAAILVSRSHAEEPDRQRVNYDLAGWMMGNFSLLDHDGQSFTQERLAGRWTFLMFGNTHCEQACTVALSCLAGMFQRIARADAVRTTQVLFVSLDPERDTPERLRLYLAPYGPRFVGATASLENLSRLLQDLDPRAISGEHRNAGDLLLIGPDAFVRGEFLPPYDVLRLTEKFMKARIGR